MLSRWRMNPSAVSDGATALAALAGLASTAFPLVLLDAMMPGIDGFDVASRSGQTPGSDAATHHDAVLRRSPGDAEQVPRPGVAAYLQKPIKQSDCSMRSSSR
jgi:CheY-like chemotaxis protein